MCGFLGEYSFNSGNVLTTESKFSEILVLSKHRGPDSTNVLRGTNYQLGFNRLAILDLSVRGNQPKTSASGRYQVVFNGEIYNYKELQAVYQLENLHSTSDTEVLVSLIERLGVKETLPLLNGMFAIAIVDTQTNWLYLTRDFAGVKPLFYGLSQKGVVFASQFNQIFKHPWFVNNLKLRASIVKEFFGFGYMQAPNTIYETIFQILPGEMLVVNAEGKLIKEQICVFNKSPIHTIKETKHVSENYNNLLDAVLKWQLVSDVPIATFLSGGIDSPLIAAHAKRNKNDIEAFTLEVFDERLNESSLARGYAQALHIKQKIIPVQANDILRIVDDHFKKIPEPFGDYSSLPTYILTQLAAKDYKVMLSGDGGDELFYGYPRFLTLVENRKWFYKFPFKVRKPLVRFLNKVNCMDTSAPYYYKTLSKWQQAKHVHIFPDVLDDMFLDVPFSDEMEALYHLEGLNSRKRLLQGLRWNEFYAHLQRVLIKVDRASMANSLEVRVPFLDKVSIDYAWQLDSELGDTHRVLKKLLKDALKQFVPAALLNTKKMGFTVPLETWLRKELRADVEKHIFDLDFYGNALMDTNQIKKYVSDFYTHKHDNAWGIWHIYAWQKWAAIHLKVTEV